MRSRMKAVAAHMESHATPISARSAVDRWWRQAWRRGDGTQMPFHDLADAVRRRRVARAERGVATRLQCRTFAGG